MERLPAFLGICLAICALLTLFLAPGFAGEPPVQDPSEVSREQWQAQVKAARARSETIRRERRFVVPAPPTPEDLAEEASRRVLETFEARWTRGH